MQSNQIIARASLALTFSALTMGSLGCSGPSTNEPQSPSTVAAALPEQPCPGLPCATEAVIETQMTAAEAAPGAHHFVVRLDGVERTCDATITDNMQRTDIPCGAGAQLVFSPVMESFQIAVAGSVGFGERPLPGQFHWVLHVYGTPASVQVIHTRDSVAVSDHTASVTYAEVRPNGPHCEPVCQQGTVNW